MNALYLEPIGGIAGDMFLAAAIDLGVPVDDLTGALRGVDVPGWRLVATRARRHAIEGTHVDVVVDAPASQERAYREIRALLGSARLDPAVRDRAAAIFGRLAEAEARVHGVPVDEVHFHEVGAVDAIIDIVGAAVAVDLLGEPRIFAAAPPMGSGTARTAHGVIPVPGPATVELLKDRPVRYEGVGELTTPTGAAILAALSEPGAPAEIVPRRVGYGLGTRDTPDRPNVLRATLGEVTAPDHRMIEVEVHLDDMSPQLFGPLFDALFAAGAADVAVAPATMKKGRPGHHLVVLCREDVREALVRTLFRETTTLGLRYHPVDRVVLERTHREVATPYGPVRVKVGTFAGEVVNAAPEFDDCVARARAAGVPVKAVLAAAQAAFAIPTGADPGRVQRGLARGGSGRTR